MTERDPGADGRRFTDVLVVEEPRVGGDKLERPPAGDPPVDLGRGLRLERIGRERADCYFAACDARASPTIRLFGEVQSFVRRNAPGDKSTEWDTDGTILAAVALSRLVCLNAIGFEYALRVTHYPEQDDDLTPLAHPRYARVPIEQPGMWITAPEARELAGLLDAYWQDKDAYPGRVRDALWFFEQTTSIRYSAIAYTQTVTTLDTLTNVETYRNRDQFESRLPALAGLVGIDLERELARSV